MTTLAQAQTAVEEARGANTPAAWHAAALAIVDYVTTQKCCPALSKRVNKALTAPLAAASREIAAMPSNVRRLRKTKPGEERHTGKTPIYHVGRCTLADGYTIRVSIGQFKGETISDSLQRLQGFTIAAWRCEQITPGIHHKAHIRIDKGAREAAKSNLDWAKRYRKQLRDAKNDSEREFIMPTLRDYIEKVGRFRRSVFVHVPAYVGRTIALGLDAQAKMDALIPPAIADCRIVKLGSGPDAGVDLENMPALAAAAE